MKQIPRYKKSNLLPQKQREQLIIQSAEKANLIMSICVLADCFGFGKKRINDFLDRYVELAKSFEYDNENLNDINEQLWKRFGIKIM